MKAMVCILMIGFAVTAAGRSRAELQSTPDRPIFSEQDQQVIARNEILRSIQDTHPWVVRRAVDAIQNPEIKGTKLLKPDRMPADESQRPHWDRERNPDLDRLQRSSAEAVHDLFQLLKKAGSQQSGAK